MIRESITINMREQIAQIPYSSSLVKFVISTSLPTTDCGVVLDENRVLSQMLRSCCCPFHKYSSNLLTWKISLALLRNAHGLVLGECSLE